MTGKSDCESKILLGAHFSIAGGLHKAVVTATEYQCSALQIFTKNATTLKERILSSQEIEDFLVAREDSDLMSLSAHAAYLINLGTPDPKKYQRSVEALENELVRATQLDIQYLVLHPGSHMRGGQEEGMKRIAKGINEALGRVQKNTCHLLLETTAGQGSCLGHTFEQLQAISVMVKDTDSIGFCLDTSHIFAAGYDIRTKKAYKKTIEAFDHTIGLDRLKVIHLNDSKKGLGTKIDRHEHIGEGYIGLDAFRFVMNDPRLKSVSKIIETPKKKGPVDYDRVNLELLRSLVNDYP